MTNLAKPAVIILAALQAQHNAANWFEKLEHASMIHRPEQFYNRLIKRILSILIKPTS